MKVKADKIYVNAKAYTLEAEGVCKEAIVVKDGKFAYVGSNEEALANYEGEVVDLGGKTVLPGMGDSHMHFFAYCQSMTTVDLSVCKTKKDALAALKKKADETPEGEWIKGSGFDQSKWQDCEADVIPTKVDLDSVSTKHPIVIKRVCLHTAVANSLALEKAGIGKGFVFGDGGLVELDADGMPNGIMREQSSKIFDEIIPDPFLIPENKQKYIKKGLAQAAQFGLTMMHTYAAEIWQYNEDINDYLALNRKGELPVRMSVCLDQFFDRPFLTKEEREDPYRAAQFGTFKIFCDGSLGSRSAKLYAPYDDAPETDGMLVISQEGLNERVYEGYVRGLQPAIHCIGDLAFGNVMTAIEYTLERTRKEGMTEREQKNKLPFRIIHAQMITDEDFERALKLPLIMDVQPSFLLTDLHWLDDRVGDRSSYCYQWKRMIDAGMLLTGGSDCPVEIFNPWNGIFSCVNRQDLECWPPEGYHPEERISVYDAVCMFSKNIPYANGEQDLMGTLEAGKFADFIVIDRDVFEIPHSEIKDIKVLNTFLAGNETYRA